MNRRRRRSLMAPALVMSLALLALVMCGGCLPVPVSGLPRTVGELEVQWSAMGRDCWVCRLSGLDYEIYLDWSAMRCEHLRVLVRPSGSGGSAGEAAVRSSAIPEGEERYRLLLSETAAEMPQLQVENLPVPMKRPAQAAHRIARELAAHEVRARQVVPEIPRALVAEIADGRFAMVPAKPASYRLMRNLHYQGGRAVYGYRGRSGRDDELSAYVSAGCSVFSLRDAGNRRYCVLLQDDELILRVPEDRSRGKLKLAGPESVDFQTFHKVASAMLRLAESEGMLERGTEQELVERTLSALASHLDFDRTETASTEAEMDPWGIVGDGGAS